MAFGSGFAQMRGFTLVSPGYRAASVHAGALVEGGRLAFAIGAQMVAELDHAELLESWAATEGLSLAERQDVSEAAAFQLMALLEDGPDAAGHGEAAADAAVVFLLAMRRQGISDPRRIPACRVMWLGNDARECVIFSA